MRTSGDDTAWPPSTFARFWRRVWPEPTTGCWLWTGAALNKGYGLVVYEGHRQTAHRVAFKHMVGPIPEGMMIRHRCDTPACVNPDHLQLGTHRSNCRDMYERGRAAIGAKHGRAKLSRRDVIEMRRLRRERGLLFRDLSKRFGVSKQQASLICNGESWAHVKEGL